MKQKLLVTALGMALIAPLAAHAEGGYVGINAGSADHKLSIDDLSESKSKTAYKLYGGYGFNKNFGLEAGYAHFGKTGDSVSNGIDSASYSIKPTAIYVALTGTLPLSEQFSMFAKVGASFNRTKLNADVNLPSSGESFSGSETRNKTSTLFGIGAAYNVTKNLSIVAEYEDFGKVMDEDGLSLKVNLFSAGLRYNF